LNGSISADQNYDLNLFRRAKLPTQNKGSRIRVYYELLLSFFLKLNATVVRQLKELIKPVDVFSIKTSRKWRQLLVSSSLVKTIFLWMELILESV